MNIKNINDGSLFKLSANISVSKEYLWWCLLNKHKIGNKLSKNGFLSCLYDKYQNNIEEKLPLIINFDNINIVSKLDPYFLNLSSTDLEIYEKQKIFVLCRKVEYNNEDNITIFDPWVDYFKIPQIERNIYEKYRDEATEPTKIKGPVMFVEIIAIYK